MAKKSPSKPRVTEVLSALKLSKDYSSVDTFYRDRGTAVHRCIELDVKGILNEATVDEVCIPYLEGFRKFWAQLRPKAFETEVHLENDDYQGTIDLVAEGRIWDYKCSKEHDKVCEIQGAAYKKLANNTLPITIVQLPGDGSFELFEYEAPIALWDATFLLWKWKKGK